MAAGEEWHLRSDSQVGEGTFGRVYKATQVATSQIVAVKKSRASLTLKLTVLNHERLLLQRLQGHPCIPEVFAYGRLEHFEYLAMEFLGMALDDVHRRCPSLPPANVLVVADQMVLALEHLHKNGIVHCDLKPGNILLHPVDPNRLYLVDYGLARSIVSKTPTTNTHTPSYHVVGTLQYASLNMHHGIHPAPRDDIESLGYSLAHLARGYLPWAYNVRHGTRKTQFNQVLLKKQRYGGRDLTPDGFSYIGDMIDYARNLKLDQLPNYELLRSQIRDTYCRVDPFAVEWHSLGKVSLDYPSPCPVPNDPSFAIRSGQIICCQGDVRTTLEGYSARAGDASFWRDPNLSSDKWTTAVRPAVVLDVEMDKRTSLWTVKVVCIGRGTLSSTDINVVPISSSPAGGSVAPNPTWPFSDSYCYVFPRPMKFTCYPGEVHPVVSTWTLNKADIDLLRERLDNDFSAQILSSSGHTHGTDFFVRITPLGPVLDDDKSTAEWGGHRAWFDEHVDLAWRRQESERGGMTQGADRGGAPPDSYYEWDFSLWGHCQGELSSSVTEGVGGLTALPQLPVIVHVEVSDDVRCQTTFT